MLAVGGSDCWIVVHGSSAAQVKHGMTTSIITTALSCDALGCAVLCCAVLSCGTVSCSGL